MAYIVVTFHGKILNVEKWDQVNAIRGALKYVMTVEKDKCHSVRKYDESKDELVHCEDELLIQGELKA